MHNCRALQAIDLEVNQLSGTVPTEWSLLVALSNLRLNDNQLQGCLPTEWEWAVATGSLTLALENNGGLTSTFCSDILTGAYLPQVHGDKHANVIKFMVSCIYRWFSVNPRCQPVIIFTVSGRVT